MLNASLPEEIDNWVTTTCSAHPQLSQQYLHKAFKVAWMLSQQEEPPDFSLSLEIATQLLSLSCDQDTIQAAILYPFFDQEDKTTQLINKELTPLVYKLLSGTKRMEAIDKLPFTPSHIKFKPKQLDNLRRMLLAIVDDIRIILIKLAERISTIKKLKTAPTEQKQEIANQAMALYAPLANRLGIGQFKWQLEDWSFRYLNPTKYAEISKELKQRRTDREIYIEKVKQEIITLLQKAHLTKYELSGRAKHIYSIYKKCERKQVPLEQIYDSNAFRILVPNIQACYHLLSLFHENYDYVQEEFDDYIAKPKPNGYRSIHTVIIGPENRNIEIQLRTFTMHQEAELGVAAHWKYKESKSEAEKYEHKIKLLRDILGWQQEIKQNETDRGTLYRQLFEDRVYLFTPNNDILDLPNGATPLDAAYLIHTELGHRCKGAKLNGKIVPLTEKVKTGDVIEIIAGKESSPSRDWANPNHGYLFTTNAINKVKSYFRREHRSEKIAKGLELWEKAAKREGFSKNDLNKVLADFNVKTVDDLLIAISLGQTPLPTILRKLKPTEDLEKEQADFIPHPHQPTPKTQVTNTQNLLTQLARCCNPIPGDEVKGYITKGRGITLHRTDCENFILASKTFPDRIIDVDWDTQAKQSYPINILISAIDRAGLIRDISTIILNENMRLLGINSQVRKTDNNCLINLTIELTDLNSLQKILTQLQHLPDVIKAERKV